MKKQTLSRDVVESYRALARATLARREGCLPPEQTAALHKVLEVADRKSVV